MAYYNNKWLNRSERQELINQVSEMYELLDSNFDNLDSEQLELYIQTAKDLEKLQRIHRAEVDSMYFAWEYFSELRNPENSGNWDQFDLPTPEDAADFHKEINGIIDHVSNIETNAKICRAAPRGHGKSSYLSKSNPLREIVFRKRKFIVVISETPTIAIGNLEWISWQLKLNKKLREDFGELLAPKKQSNIKDNQEEFVTYETYEDKSFKQLTYVKSVSTNQAIRGLNWDGVRPDLIVCDDLEGIHTNAGTPEQRNKLRNWFYSDVLPLGDPKGKRTAFIYMGTIVHQDSLLNHVINESPNFDSKKYQAIIQSPSDMELWEECRQIYLDRKLSPKERKQAASEFYQTNKEEMDKGVIVLWEEAKPIFTLMCMKWDDSKSFATEYQNDPRDEESQVFTPDNYARFKQDEIEEQPLDYFGFWDIASGKNLKRTDYNAIVTVARNRRTGTIYTVDIWAKKCKMDEALKQATSIIQKYNHKRFALEDIGVGFSMPSELKKKLASMYHYSTKIVPISNHKRSKEDRIASLQPLCEQGFLLFKADQQLLFDQMEQFPGGTHDDVPDALSGAVDLAKSSEKMGVITRKKKPNGF
jgi:predicted phage terminase large subunit-like protein